MILSSSTRPMSTPPIEQYAEGSLKRWRLDRIYGCTADIQTSKPACLLLIGDSEDELKFAEKFQSAWMERYITEAALRARCQTAFVQLTCRLLSNCHDCKARPENPISSHQCAVKYCTSLSTGLTNPRRLSAASDQTSSP